MKRYWKYLLNTLVVFILFLLFVLSASATTISYDTTDLTDVTSGEDLWSTTFYVDDVDLSAGEGLQIVFDFGLYDDIAYVSGQDVDDLEPFWVLSPGTTPFGSQYEGVLDAMAAADTTRSFSFTVNYSWLGNEGTAPADFYFEVYDAAWEVTESGTSSPASSNSPVPEPASMILLGVGLLGLSGTLRNKKS